MGDPKKLRKKYSTPSHPWQKLRIEEERELLKAYGLKNKEEVWKHNSLLRDFKSQVKALIPKRDEASEIAKSQLIQKLAKLKLVAENSKLEDILAITLKDLCERRLQSILVKKKLARGIKQARQFIVHEHILVKGRKITSPSYLVDAEEEDSISFVPGSSLFMPDHPERVQMEKEVAQEKANAMLPKAEEAE